MNEWNIRLIRQYRVQIVLIIVSIVALLITITVLKLLIDIARGYRDPSQEGDKIIQRSRVSALLFLIVIIYFLYYAVETYRRKPNNTNYIFMVAAIIVMIGAVLRVINLFGPNTSVSGAEDVD